MDLTKIQIRGGAGQHVKANDGNRSRVGDSRFVLGRLSSDLSHARRIADGLGSLASLRSGAVDGGS